MDDNRTIDFIEFFSGLDKLRIKMSEEDAMKCFKYLNSQNDGEIDYNQFCALVEERRRGIDPFSTANEGTPNAKNAKRSESEDRARLIDLTALGLPDDERIAREVHR